jgi:hypothetical protein
MKASKSEFILQKAATEPPASGFGKLKFRVKEVYDTLVVKVHVKLTQGKETCTAVKQLATKEYEAFGKQGVKEYSKERVKAAVSLVKGKVAMLGMEASMIAKDGKFQAASAGVVGGAALLGGGGGAAGLLTGSVLGAACGILPAVFTFGLSIPIAAAFGGTAGLAIGTAVGSAAGAVGGGATGYGLYVKKDAIKARASYIKDGATSKVSMVKAKLADGWTSLKGNVKNKLSRSGTGGTN